MSVAVIIALISVAAVCVSTLIAYVQWRENHSTKVSDDMHATIKEIAHTASEPLIAAVQDHTNRLTQTGDRLNRIEDLVKSNSADLRTAVETMTRMGVKVDMYWSTLEALAMNSAKGLHQPDPRRARIDYLLEAFMEGTLTDSERIELKKLLVQIRNYEPGGPELGFPVYPGEHTLATILFSTIDLVDPNHMAAMGHAAHRSVAHKKIQEGNKNV
jgi:hypothetical protein